MWLGLNKLNLTNVIWSLVNLSQYHPIQPNDNIIIQGIHCASVITFWIWFHFFWLNDIFSLSEIEKKWDFFLSEWYLLIRFPIKYYRLGKSFCRIREEKAENVCKQKERERKQRDNLKSKSKENMSHVKVKREDRGKYVDVIF